jgi:CelD/BcsL family acetyltransferase involved in cellulose biosynthesis
MTLDAELVAYADQKEAYRALYASYGSSRFYTSPDWVELLQQAFPRLTMLVVRCTDGALTRAMFPIAQINGRLLALPLTPQLSMIACGTQNAEEREAACRAISGFFSRASKSAELRVADFVDPEGTAEQSSAYVTSVLSLADAQEKHWSENARRSVKRASKAGVRVEESDDFDLMWEFVCRTRRRQGTPLYPRRLFDGLARLHGQGAPVQLYFSRTASGEAISGIVIFKEPDRIFYAFGASCEDETLLSSRGNFLLFAEALRRAREEGKACFDFGISPSGNTGLIRFKEQWGAVSRPSPRLLFGRRKRAAREGALARLASSCIRLCPSPIYRRFTPFLFERIV